MIIKSVIIILVLFVIPELLGLLILRVWKEQKNNIILAFILGYIIEFAIGQLVSVPLIFKDDSLTELVRWYIAIVGAFTIISFVINMFSIKEIIIDVYTNIKTIPILASLLIIILIGMQLLIYAKYVHIDDDDAYYVATATSAVQTDTLFKYSAMTGTSKRVEQYLLSYRLGPFPLFYAIVSKLINIHPAIIAHTVLPIILLTINYMIYWLFAKVLFGDNKNSALLFMLFICILHFFSFYNGKSNFIYAVTRIWQGKSILASIILPLLLLLYLYKEKYKSKYIGYIAILITALGGNYVTTMSIAMIPITVMLIAFIYECVKLASKEVKLKDSLIVLVKSLVCCMPSIVYGLIYIKDYLR